MAIETMDVVFSVYIASVFAFVIYKALTKNSGIIETRSKKDLGGKE